MTGIEQKPSQVGLDADFRRDNEAISHCENYGRIQVTKWRESRAQVRTLIMPRRKWKCAKIHNRARRNTRGYKCPRTQRIEIQTKIPSSSSTLIQNAEPVTFASSRYYHFRAATKESGGGMLFLSEKKGTAAKAQYEYATFPRLIAPTDQVQCREAQVFQLQESRERMHLRAAQRPFPQG